MTEPYFMVPKISSGQAHQVAMVAAQAVANSLSAGMETTSWIAESVSKAYQDTYESVIGWMPSTPVGVPELNFPFQRGENG